MPDDLPETTQPVVDRAVDHDVTPVRVVQPPSVLTYVGLLVGGVVLGLFGAVLMASRATVGGASVPWGLLLSLVAVLTCVRGAAWLVGSRRGAALVGLGWVLPTLAFSITNPGGDVLLPDLTRTYVYLFGSALFVVLAVVLPMPRGAAALAAEWRGRRHDVTAPDAEPVDVVES